ncbi:MAG TPA: hypothetical protein VGF36_00900, partial [Rhodopila sp.]
MTGIVLTEFTDTVNLRHFFVPREVVPRTMAANMLCFVYGGNPVKAGFLLQCDEYPTRQVPWRAKCRDQNNAESMTSNLLIAMVGVLLAAILRGFTGFGFGLAAVPLLSLALPPVEVVPLVVALQA